MSKIKNVLISLIATVGLAGCASSSGDRTIYNQLAQNPQGNLIGHQISGEYYTGNETPESGTPCYTEGNYYPSNYSSVNPFVLNHPQFFPGAGHYERGLWRENAHIDIPVDSVTKKRECIDRDYRTKGNAIIGNLCTSPLIFKNSGCVEQHILEETRGANFLNPNDRADAERRASQIREREWNRQVREWERKIEANGGKRAK